MDETHCRPYWLQPPPPRPTATTEGVFLPLPYLRLSLSSLCVARLLILADERGSWWTTEKKFGHLSTVLPLVALN